MFEGFVVAREPLLGSGDAAVDVVPHEVVQMFGNLPLHKHRRLGVSGGDDLTGSRGDACARDKELLLNTRNDVIIKNVYLFSFRAVDLIDVTKVDQHVRKKQQISTFSI